jgi:hypothetical protein
MDKTDYDALNIGSLTGVIGATMFIVEILKKIIKPTTPVLGKIPLMLFPILIAPGLALLCNKVFILDNGAPILSGNLWVVMYRAFLSAASTSGLYEWLRHGDKTIGDSKPLTQKDDPQ